MWPFKKDLRCDLCEKERIMEASKALFCKKHNDIFMKIKLRRIEEYNNEQKEVNKHGKDNKLC